MKLPEALKDMVKNSLKETKEIIKNHYYFLGKKEFSKEDFIAIKELVREPYLKRILKSGATCFLGTFYLIGQLLGLFTGGLLVLMLGLILIIFIFITNPFRHILYRYWYKKAMKQKERILSEAKEVGLI